MMTYIDLRTGAEMFGCRSSVLCLGTFDGVHRGHAELIEQTLLMRDRLKEDDLQILGGAWCFRQPPAEFLFGETHLCLTTLEEKLNLFSKMGLDIAVLGDFSELRNMPHTDFAENILKDKLGCEASVCGFNFKFGKGGEGTAADLVSVLGKECRVISPVTVGGNTVSSSLIRKYLSDGDAESAKEMLGRPYFSELTVVKGKMLGRQWGIPTINQFFTEEKFVPRKGVYATTSEVDGKTYMSVTNVGTNPTVGDVGIRCETHIIGFDGDLYGEKIKVNFHKFLRGEQKFNSISELTDAIKKNIHDTKHYFNKA